MEASNPSINSTGPTHRSKKSTIYSQTSRRRKLSLTSRTKLSTLLKTSQREEIVSKLGKTEETNDELIEDKSRQKVVFGLILMLTSGVLYSGLATLVRWASNLGFSAAEILVYRATVQMIVAGTTYYLKHRKMKKEYINLPSAQYMTDSMKTLLSKKQILAVLGRGMFGAGSTFTYFEGTTLIPVGDCVSLKALAAIFTSFAGWIILGDKISMKHGGALVFAMIGVILITQPPMIFAYVDPKIDTDFKNDLPGYLVSTASSCFQCGVYICIKLAGKVPVVMLIFSQGTFSCLLGVLVIMFWVKEFHFFTGDVWQEYVCIAGVCGIGYVSQWTLTRGGQLLIAGLASLMRATDIAWSFLWGWLFFSQKPNFLTIIGAVTMFASVLMVSLEKIKKAALQNAIEVDFPPDNDKEYTVHTTDVWTVTIEEKKDNLVPLKRGSFTFGSSVNSPGRHKEKLQIKYVTLTEGDEKFSDDDMTSDLTPSPKSQKKIVKV